MKLKAIVHPADEGGYWAEIPSISGRAAQGETSSALLAGIYEAVQARVVVHFGQEELSATNPVPGTAIEI